MPADHSVAEYVATDVLQELGEVAARAMFGGFGLYHQGAMFGLIIGGEVYFKVDEPLIARHKAAGGQPFVYRRKDGKKTTMPYWSVPDPSSKTAAWSLNGHATAGSWPRSK